MKRKAQMSRRLELPLKGQGEARNPQRSVPDSPPAEVDEQGPARGPLMELIVDSANIMRAVRRVKENRGSPGIDGMSVQDLPNWMAENWKRTREDLLAGRYQPQPVRRVSIPKRGGGLRQLGIPTVRDRLIQQAVLQILQPAFDPTFSEHSHGFRPGRRAHDAVREAQGHIQAGKEWVVDVDLEKFFDRVNHDVLMSRLARRITDKRVLRLCRRFLEAGVLLEGVTVRTEEGTPQGGPLSPLLANVLLDEVDKELERRGHAFVRYADDLRVFTSSQRAGERVMSALVRLFGKLRLRVNQAKSKVTRATKSAFLGFGFRKRKGVILLSVAEGSIKAFKDRIRELTRRTSGRSLMRVIEGLRKFMVGWRAYYGIVDVRSVFERLMSWIRRRLRAIQLVHWKRSKAMIEVVMAKGLTRHEAVVLYLNRRRVWRTSQNKLMRIAFPNRYFSRLGLPELVP